MTSCLSPYSVLSLVRRRIHALRKSTELSVHLQVVVIPVITQRQIPMVLVTKEILVLLGGGPDVQKTVFPTVAVPVSPLTCPLLRTTGLGGVAGAVHRRWWTSLWCRSDKFQLSVLKAGMRGRFFGALHTDAGPREPCPQGHGLHI